MQGFILNPMTFLIALFFGMLLVVFYLSRDTRVKHAPESSYEIVEESRSDKLLLAAEEGKPVDAPDLAGAEQKADQTGRRRGYI